MKNNKMKLLFTNSPLHFTHGHTFTQSDWQTLVLPYLAGITGKEHDIKLVDNMHYSFWKSNNILEEIEEFKPDVVGFSIIASRDIFKTMNIIKKTKEKYKDLKIIAGGQAGTYYKNWLLKSGADFVVDKEGEKTLVELIEAIENNSDFSKVKGISYIDNEEIKTTEKRPFIKSLDDTPFPRFDLMPKLKSKWFKGRYTGSIEMSRGCPFNCNFCSITAFWEDGLRQKSNERILEELERLKHEGRTHIYLADDNFGTNTKKHIELFEEILKRGLDIKFFAQIRTDTVAKHPDMIELGAKAGLYGVLVGFDTYESTMFNDITKTTSKELNIKASETLRKNKIAIFGSHIYGLPTQKEPSDFEITFELGRKYSDLFRMPYFSPLPFTKGYEELVTVNPINKKDIPSEEEYLRDFRPRLGDEEYQKKMEKGYLRYNRRNNLSLSEIKGALFHPNPAVRTLKRQGYIGVIRHKIYKNLRKFGLTDI